MVLLAAGAGGVRAAGRPPVGVVKVNAGAGSVDGWLMNIFYGKKKYIVWRGYLTVRVGLPVVGVKVIHGFWGTISLHELPQCTNNYILRWLLPLNFDVTPFSLYHIRSFY